MCLCVCVAAPGFLIRLLKCVSVEGRRQALCASQSGRACAYKCVCVCVYKRLRCWRDLSLSGPHIFGTGCVDTLPEGEGSSRGCGEQWFPTPAARLPQSCLCIPGLPGLRKCLDSLEQITHLERQKYGLFLLLSFTHICMRPCSCTHTSPLYPPQVLPHAFFKLSVVPLFMWHASIRVAHRCRNTLKKCI